MDSLIFYSVYWVLSPIYGEFLTRPSISLPDPSSGWRPVKYSAEVKVAWESRSLDNSHPD